MSKNKTELDNEIRDNKVKIKKHHNPARGAVRIIALLLALIMLFASAGTLIFYLMLK